MARDINLNSAAWCDIVFEGRNKAYGAYAMRQTSAKRHLMAFGSIVILTAMVSLVPSFLDAINTQKQRNEGYSTSVTLSNDPNLAKPEEEIIVPPTVAPPVPIVNSVQYTPPAIVDDAEVNPENEMRNQEDLRDSNARISTDTHVSDNTEGVDPGELRRSEQAAITGTPVILPETPIDFAQEMPQYPGGNAEMMKYLKNNMKYPTIAAEVGIQGKVILRFVVGKDGKISDVKVVKGIDPSCDNEAMRVVKAMQPWIPGRQNGNPVAVYFTLPVTFQLMK